MSPCDWISFLALLIGVGLFTIAYLALAAGAVLLLMRLWTR